MFEYKILTLDMSNAKSREDAENILNQLSKEKWDVVNFSDTVAACIRVMLKRAL